MYLESYDILNILKLKLHNVFTLKTSPVSNQKNNSPLEINAYTMLYPFFLEKFIIVLVNHSEMATSFRLLLNHSTIIKNNLARLYIFPSMFDSQT